MSFIRIKSIKVANYRSFKEEQDFYFPDISYKKPVAIVGYNNCGKTNLMNAILYWIGYNFFKSDSLDRNDFYQRDMKNKPYIEINLDASIVWKNSKWYDLTANWIHKTTIEIKDWIILEASISPSYYGVNKLYEVFYINFHCIKDEISTSKTSRWNLKSFLAKHIKKLVDEDPLMKSRQEAFSNSIKLACSIVLDGQATDETVLEHRQSKLSNFIDLIKINYSKNLRDNNIEIDFWLPDYEDIFLQMMFKIGLNGSTDNLVPISHFWDWYISMFVMAVIQAIAEENTEDKCLFLFEEPESFLHENHQEYFYKMVLCGLTQKWHQVIYTTHSDKMVDIFDTKWIIRLDMEWGKTEKKYNDVNKKIEPREEIVNIKKYNDYIRTIEPNLNKLLFSKKVILVEWPNDVMVYKYCIQKKVEEKMVSIINPEERKRFAETYLNFYNIAIIPHHWKSTAIYLIKLCKHFWLEYFAINDRDFDNDDLSIATLSLFSDIEEMQWNIIYTSSDSTRKGKITTNFKLIEEWWDFIHFNVPKLEKVIWREIDDKNSYQIYNHLSSSNFTISNELFHDKLEQFLWMHNLS